MNWPHIIELLQHEMATGIVSNSLLRLLLAAVLGGVIGLEREMKHKPAGLRTNMFICFGSALFTILSDALAAEHTGDHTRIAAQIIPGIGFIGAGSIIHGRGLITGLTTAATLFVVASVGMAAGGGLYLTAVFSTAVIVIALLALGRAEKIFNLKLIMMTYEVTGGSVDEVTQEVNRLLEREHRMMEHVATASTGQHVRVQFDIEGTHREQERFLRQMKESRVLTGVTSLWPVDRE